MPNAQSAEAALRVVQVLSTLHPSDGGPAHNAAGVARALSGQGIFVSQFVWNGAPEEALRTPKQVQTRFRSESRGPTWLVELSTALRSADLVICHGWYTLPSVLAAALSVVRGKPFVIVPHGVFTEYQRHRSKFRKQLFDLSIGQVHRRAQALCVATAHEGEVASRVKRLPHFVTGIGVDIPTSTELSDGPGDMNPIRVLSMSRVAPKKRLDLSIRAMAVLRSKGLPAILDVAGDGDQNLVSRLSELAHALGVSDLVIWHGLVAGRQKDLLFNQAHIFLLPSDDENFGIGIVEALAHGVPVVTTAAADASAYVVMAGSGAVLQSPTPEAIAQAISDLCADKADWVLRSSRAKAVVRSDLGWDQVAHRWIALCAQLKVR